MSLSPVSRRFTPRFRGVPFAFLLLGALLCGATQPPSTPGPSLTEGLVLERDLKGGEAHVYPVDLQAGQFLRVQVQEEGIDVTVRLLDPQGAFVTGADSLSLGAPQSLEELAAVADSPGPYRLEVGAPSKSVQPGRYRLEVVALRSEREGDRLRGEAIRESWAAFHPSKGDALASRIKALERASDLWERLGERRQRAAAILGLGLLRSSAQEEAGAALDAYLRSAALWAAEADPAAKSYQGFALNKAGSLLRKLGRAEEARQRYEEALEIARQTGDLHGQAVNLSNLGLLACDQGEPRRGIELLTESLAKAREIQDRPAEGRDIINLAFAYEQLQESQKAVQYYQEALTLARALSSQELEATALNNLGDTYLSLGDFETAINYFRQALPLIHQRGDHIHEARTLINFGDALRRLNQFGEAGKVFGQALALGREIEDAETQTAALTAQAFLFIKSHQPARAVEPARQALGLAQGFPEREMNALYALGLAHRELGESRAARGELDRAFSLSKSLGDRSREAEISLALARVERSGGNWKAALDRAKSSIEIIESIRTRVLDPRLRTSFLATKQDYYELLIDTLMPAPGTPPGGPRAAEALQVSERARARNLLDILSESGADLRAGVDPRLTERESRLRDQVSARDRYRFKLLTEGKADPRKLEEADRQLVEALDEYNRVQADLRASSPSYAALTQPQPLSVAQIQEQILDGKAILLEYALGPKRSFLWVVTADSLQSFELPGRERIEKTARHYYELLTARNERHPSESLQAWKRRIDGTDAEALHAGSELSRMILAPAEHLLGERPLLIVADGALQYIPFAALPVSSSGAPLVIRHEVVSLPSASTLAVLRHEVRGRSRAPKTLAVFADPIFETTDPRLTHRPERVDRMSLASETTRGWSPADERQAGGERPAFRRLLSSRKEAETLAALVPRDQIFLAVGFSASRAKATSPELAQYRNVHFATHGVLDSRRPELSKLVLSLYDEKGRSEDGFLRLNDIYSLHLDADLVVLSACQTALGKEIRGEGLVGLTRGFMDAGAARVVASLWSVEDRATAELMGSFYRAMLRDKLSPAAALRRAQIEMASRPGRKSPYYWAGFSLQGEWK